MSFDLEDRHNRSKGIYFHEMNPYWDQNTNQEDYSRTVVGIMVINKGGWKSEVFSQVLWDQVKWH